MKPYKTVVFLLVVFVIILDISLFFPSEGIHITDNFKLKFFSYKDIFEKDTVEYADITSIISRQEQINDSVIRDLAGLEVTDTVVGFDTVRADARKLLDNLQRIEYPPGNDEVLFPAFKSLSRLSGRKELIRILHYGDSQIEGDRITSYIRFKLQQKFGGFGVGLIPASQPYDFSFSISQTPSDNWLRYTLYGKKDTTLPHNKYGALASFCRFSPVLDSTRQASDVFTEAFVNIEPSPYSYSNTRKFQQVRIFYGNNTTPFMNEIKQGDKTVMADMYAPTDKLKVITARFNEPVGNITLRFSGHDSPDVYAISLDAPSGVAVDNIAMRGSSGLVFNKMDARHLKSMYKALNVKMFILEYGGNVVPYIEKNPKQYGVWFGRQLQFLKKLMPEVPILVIGVADMSEKVGNRYRTYTHLEQIRDAMKEATLNAGCAYWDMYEAMGGKNSMPGWVFAQPALASTDFVHFTPRGAKLIAKMFYSAFLYEYNIYMNQKGP
ncbi:MAG: hypothetical protein GVY19_03545 [Bacteroidetes bacterium]|jgi:lysophospholipase L1-like esterase|nr:hypothetical protein [Bacteroidota bacterium]